MPAIKPVPVPAPVPAVRSEPAPVYRTPEPAPVAPPALKADKPAADPLLAQIKAALARTDSQLAQWAGGNTQFEATRFMLNGQFNALRAVARALEGDLKALEGL